MRLNDWTTGADLAYAAHVCACPNCKRLANRAAEGLRAALTFTRAYEAFSHAAVLYPQALLWQQSFMQTILFLNSSAFCAALDVCSTN